MATLFASINGGNEPTNGDGAVQVPTYILYPNIHRPNPRVVSAKGLYLTLEDGQVILDATGGPAVACLGHGNQEVQNAVMRQMEKFSFVHTLSYANDSAEDLARWVITSTDGVMAKATIMGSGNYMLIL
jgi:adenosylmethionine-8-amino-7-oxononanoate aminotransferase